MKKAPDDIEALLEACRKIGLKKIEFNNKDAGNPYVFVQGTRYHTKSDGHVETNIYRNTLREALTFFYESP